MIERYYRELLSYFTRRGTTPEHAADIVQEAYSRVLAVQRAGVATPQPRALLYRTARNIMIDLQRRAGTRGEHLSLEQTEDLGQELPLRQAAGSDPAAALSSTQTMQAVLAAIDQLPLRCREAFILHKFDGLSQAEVGQRMGISVKAVEQHIRHAMLVCRAARASQEQNPGQPVEPSQSRR